MNIQATIQGRRSRRTFRDEPVATELLQELKEYIRQVDGPFQTKMHFEILDLAQAGKEMKLGTYGVIKGAKTFLVAVMEREPRCEENIGYAFEKIILKATAMGLGTCWLGGTFNRAQFTETVGIEDSAMIPVISPLGYAKEKRSLVDNMVVKIAGSDHRKDWQMLFFDQEFAHPLTKEGAGEAREILEMVRLGPSASNRQPWRIVKDGELFHFFLTRTKGYASPFGFDIQRVDVGIAMCHFELTARERGYGCCWIDLDPYIQMPIDTEYMITCRMDK